MYRTYCKGAMGTKVRGHLLFSFKRKSLFIWKAERHRRKRQRSSSCWFTHQMTATAGAKEGWNQQPRTPPWFPTQVAKTQALKPSPAASQDALQEAGWKGRNHGLNGHFPVGCRCQGVTQLLSRNTCPTFSFFLNTVLPHGSQCLGLEALEINDY